MKHFLFLFLSFFFAYILHAQLNIQASKALVERIVPGHADQFSIEALKSVDDKDVFEIESRGNRIVLRGSTGVAVASALYYYLNKYCHAQITWNGTNLKLPAVLPQPVEKIHKATPYEYRYYMNYCTFNYSMSWWDWKRWEKEIDWMALHGINMPLAITGEEYTWYLVYKEMGFSDKDLKAFFCGPSYFSWFWMGNLDGWGGPLPINWMQSHFELQKKILQRERALGMKPVLPAFTGHVPKAFKQKFPDAKLKMTNWTNGFADTYILDPEDPMFAMIGKKFLEKQTALLGTDHLYSADTFNENEPPSDEPGFLSRVSAKVYEGMRQADTAAIWVMQGWLFYSDRKFWREPQTEALLKAVPNNKMILLDLATEIEPVWKRTEAFYGKPWIWNMLHNFGGNTNLFGRMETVAVEPAKALQDTRSGNMKGIGLTMEGIEQNPVMYELMMANTWQAEPIDLNKWLPAYVRNRYGVENADALTAWNILRNTVYHVPADKYIRDGAESIIQGRPTFDSLTRWTKTKLNYDPKDMLLAWDALINASNACQASDGFQYDLIDVTRQVLANYALPLQQRFVAAYKNKNIDDFKKYAQQFIELIKDMDRLLATRKEFLLGPWVADARKWGTTEKEKALYEMNAKDLVTLWGDENCPLNEYACRQWSGLMNDFYKTRWQQFFDKVLIAMQNGKEFQKDVFATDIKKWEWQWVNKRKDYPLAVKGNPVSIAKDIYKKYRSAVSLADKPTGGGRVDQNLLQYVQPLSGTAASVTPAAVKHSEEGSEKNANTIPAVGLPFAMTQWTAQTRLTENKCIPPYFYKDSLLSGFRGTHWLSGSCTQDYGSVTIMPVSGKLRTTVNEYAVPFSHADETTSPAYYKLDLPTARVTTEITSSLRCGVMQFTMQQDDSLYLLIMPNSDKGKGFIRVDKIKGEIYGYNPVHRIYQGWGEPAGFNGWFYIKLEKEISRSGTFSGNEIFFADSIKDKKDIGAFVGFVMRKGEQLRIRIGTSFSSWEGAKRNLQAEIGSRSFNEVLTYAEQIWNTALSQISIQTTNEKDKRIFYTAMYHAMQHPRLYNDVDGAYPKFAGNYELKKLTKGPGSRSRDYYDDFSMWDIYRAQLPLLEILKPDKVNDFVQSLIVKGQEGGWLPIFPCWNSYTAAMIGDHVTAFIAAAYNKGIRDYDVNAAYALMRRNAFETPESFEEYKNGMGRRALSSYLKYGYIPMEDSIQEAFHKKEQVSRTLEYAYDDYGLSVVAKALNKTDDYKKLRQRSFNYENVFDRSVAMVRGRYADGKWCESFNADRREAYITEGTPRQYSFYVPHNVPGLSKLLGGSKFLEISLDSLFGRSEYWHGNEPGHQIPFMYNYTGSPWKTQREVRKLLGDEYSDGPGGLSGNDDAGQMSAWYVFAAMGFYPINPVSGEYILSSPLFDKIRIQLPGEKQFEISTHRLSAADIFINKVMWDGRAYDKNFITYKMIIQGGQLEIWLTDKPTTWGSNNHNWSPGLTK